MFAKLGVGTRIYVAFGAMGAIILGLGAMAMLGMNEAEHMFQDYRQAARQTIEIGDYDADVASLRVNFLNYLREPSAERAEAVKLMVEDVGTTDADGKALFSGDDIAAIDQVTEMAQAYGGAFDALVTAKAAGDVAGETAAVDTITSIGSAMQALYSEMSDRAADTQNRLGPEIAEKVHFQVLLIMIVSGLGVLAGAVVAFVTGRWLSRAIAGMTNSMRELAQGKFDIAISGAGSQHELGQMAKALEVFRANGLKVAQADIERGAAAAAAAERAETMERFQDAFDGVIASTAEGDFSKRIDGRFGDANLDRIAGNFNGLVDSVGQALGEAGTVLGALAAAQLDQRMTGSYRGEFNDLKQSTNAVADKLTEIVVKLKETSGTLRMATGEILAGANDLSERTTRQAATIEETSAAMEQLAGTVQRNAERALEANQTAGRVTTIAEQSGAVMEQTTLAMDRITTSSSKISNIIGLIDDIAFQTNLLALNASVEAARAGDAGKGFAVVAVEVRRLAQSAASASSEVKALIEQSAGEVGTGTKLVNEVASKLAEILEGIRATGGLMDGVARDSQEQSAGIKEVGVAVRQMDEMTQHNAALVEEMNASIEQTEGQAGQLDSIVSQFQLGSVESRSPATEARKAPPAVVAMPKERVKSAARQYLSQGNAAVAEDDWSEF